MESSLVSKRTIPLLNSLITLSLVKHKVFRETLAQRCKLGRSNFELDFCDQSYENSGIGK